MKNAQEVILSPVITENSMAGMQQHKKYTFGVAMSATKVEIKKAVEELFGVKVDKVHTMHMRGRTKRMGRTVGTTPAWKKAIVTLTADSKGIEFFDSMM